MKLRLLVDLDCILDTRLGLLYNISKEAHLRVMNNLDNYIYRPSDNFEKLTDGLVTNTDYRHKWKSRDASCLPSSVRTNFMTHLYNELYQAVLMKDGPKEIESVSVSVNIYPYSVGDKVIAGLISAVTALLPVDIDVTHCSYSPSDLTPRTLDSNYDGYYLYDFDEWWKYQHVRLLTDHIREFTIRSPALSLPGKELVTEAEYTVDDVVINPFDYLRLQCSEFVTLEFFDTSLISVISGDYD